MDKLEMSPSNHTYEFIVEEMFKACSILAKDVAGGLSEFSWIFAPVLISTAVLFLMPMLTIVFVYLNGIFLVLYRYWYGNKDRLSPDFWDTGRRLTMKFWSTYGKIWHGHEIIGLENIPKEGPGVIVYYHGALPVDWYSTHSTIYLTLNRLVYSIGDKFVFQLPVFNSFIESLRIHIGTVEECVSCLHNGDLLAIAPGGMREAQFADSSYQLLWGKRLGFAKVAIKGKAPIIPVFTTNIREIFCPLSIGKHWFRKWYEATRIPIVPIYGNFPVKLKTVIGKPIPYDPKMSAEQLAEKTSKAVKQLIAQHQRVPGNVTRALLERFPHLCKKIY
ncbi:transmembrane protein 68-like [Centruroides sculpturatus]|uniref:transmembrane protein 68-like n=1 Tax=Centruroides sculpturatus TaxID=218467 RepID=UPI000C6ED310|nr:transmembrane protein 68-like [Centruroides sculpturatus]XP_023209944.1 transmembrane protein 68-like [Centruroides sculpturatus]XP_023209945.1 transmembrane protein 68-like [Centruroides sculpturatus]